MSKFLPEISTVLRWFCNLRSIEENGCWKLSIVALSSWWTQKAYERWFKRFKSGNFDLKGKGRLGQKKTLKVQIYKHYWTKTELKR